MEVSIRRLRAEDIEQVKEIEREAFAPLFMGNSLKRDLNNRYARYLVACQPEIENSESFASSAEALQEEVGAPSDASLWGRMVGGVKGIFAREPEVDTGPENIAGYVGLWFQGNEAHITEIAVREKLRGNGIGELLLIGSVRVAIEQGSTVLTLEARVSNFIAQRLYEKYGFQEAGIRKNYYSDNREDAVIMTTSPIHTPGYQERFNSLQEAFLNRWGEINIEI
ncbi:MAG: ribosomal protein S18-alanine N-acetyltransferase [Chloroflexi bacterium]|nr:ribosomal protein S18-alanine N-acetyltransferase [Chloroflexota bacterium]